MSQTTRRYLAAVAIDFGARNVGLRLLVVEGATCDALIARVQRYVQDNKDLSLGRVHSISLTPIGKALRTPTTDGVADVLDQCVYVDNAFGYVWSCELALKDARETIGALELELEKAGRGE